MLTVEDCLALCDLTEEEVKAITRDDIDRAAGRGDSRRVLQLKLVLRHFVETHGSPAQADDRRAAG